MTHDDLMAIKGCVVWAVFTIGTMLLFVIYILEQILNELRKDKK